MHSPLLRLAAVLVVLAGLTSCARTVAVEVAPLADDPACAEAMVDLPDAIGASDRDETTSQSTAAWGEPAITWRCGLDPLGPTTDPCYSFGDVDWIATQDGDDFLFTTFGRSPAVQVRIPAGSDEDRGVSLATLAAAVAAFPQGARCQSLEDLTSTTG